SAPGFPDNTIFAALSTAGVSNRYFYTDIPVSALWGASGLSRSGNVQEYYQRCASGTLPAVSFVDPAFANEDGGTSGDEHPHGDVRVGQAFMSDVVHAFVEPPQWKRGALFIVYDAWGGIFGHLRPPRMPDQRTSTQPRCPRRRTSSGSSAPTAASACCRRPRALRSGPRRTTSRSCATRATSSSSASTIAPRRPSPPSGTPRRSSPHTARRAGDAA